MTLTDEERQARAWIRAVLRHAAIRWQSRQHRQSRGQTIPWDTLKEELWTNQQLDNSQSEWMRQCLTRITLRDQIILRALTAGWTQRAIAHVLHCHVRTIRRRIQHIRKACPY